MPASPAPWWCWGGHAQTIASATWARRHPRHLTPPQPTWHSWPTPDGDVVALAQFAELPQPSATPQPVLVMFHGLEGSANSHYAQAMATACEQAGVALWVLHFRGCGGLPNQQPRAYHAGDKAEIDWMLARVAELTPGRPRAAVGISLGGNALMRWASAHGTQAARYVNAVAAVSAPFDLAAAGHAIEQGANRWLYTPMFLRTMKQKARAMQQAYPDLLDWARVQKARTIRAFDDAFTAPLHGFAGVNDYWAQASAGPHLSALALPAWLCHAQNDPFVPYTSIAPWRGTTNATWVTPPTGGHAGFLHAAGAPWRGQLWRWCEELLQWLRPHAYG